MVTPIEHIYFPVKNGKTDFASKLDTVIHHRFTDEPTFLQGFISQDIASANNSIFKQFLTISNFSAWLHTDIIDSKQNRYLYELIPSGKPVHPYFDIEFDAEQLNDLETCDIVWNILTNCFQQIGIQLQSEHISIFCSTGKCSTDKITSGWKASFHFILNTPQVFRNTFEHKSFLNNIIIPYINNDLELVQKMYWTDAKGVKKCVIDNAVYGSNQGFRLPFQSKLGSDRILTPQLNVTTYSIGVYSDPSTLDFITIPDSTHIHDSIILIPQHFKQIESPEFPLIHAITSLYTDAFLTSFQDTRDLIWGLWNIEQTQRMFDLIHSICSRGSNYEYKWVNDLIYAWKYGAINIGSIIRWAKQCSDHKTVNMLLTQYNVNYNQELFTCHMIPQKHTVLDQRYLGHSVSFNDYNTLILKSHLGTGKTVSISNIIHNGGYIRILIVSPRKSYTHAQHGSLTEFTSYLDHFYGDLSHISHLIIQVESLHRIGNGFQKYDLVILDEIESILNQLHSVKTNASNLITNHEALAMAVSTASHVIMADAFISDRTFNFSNELRNHETTHYFENVFNPYKRRAILLPSVENDTRIANIGGFCERICEALRTGKRIVVLWTSKRRGDWFVKHFLDNWLCDRDCDVKPSWIFYNSASTKEEQDGLKNVNESWKSVQCLMMTTSITVGISYNPQITELEFDEAFLYGSSASAMPRDIAQALFRVRSLKSNRLTYVLDTRASYDIRIRGFNNIWNELAKKESTLMRLHPLVKWTTCPQWARYNYCYCENEERNSRAQYKAVLDEYLVRSGYGLFEEVHIPCHKVSAIRVDLDDKDSLIWDNIDSIDSGVADDISKAMKRGDASVDHILCYKKWRFRSEFRTDCSDADLKSLWARFYESSCEGRFWNVILEKRLTVTDLARSEALKRYGIMSGDSVKKRETLERFLKILGMTHSQHEILISTEMLDKIGIQLSKDEKELREGLGLRASQRKTKEWTVANTIDLITVVLDMWGCGTVECVIKMKKVDKKPIRFYSIQINKGNKLWSSILGSNINYEENQLRL